VSFTLHDLEALIAERDRARRGPLPPGAKPSYTAELLEAGPARAAKKLGEEAVEAVIAAVEGNRDALRAEAADLLYHLLVVLRVRGVPLADVLAELGRRTGRSGLEEKAARGGRGGLERPD
jgi:phosphoribosyl-ATP pyrophosphohydrolase